jgi:uncharacterized protein YodC (DUF2158 family)
MADPLFKIGDVVRERIGGPDMTISKVADSAGGQLLTCTWLANAATQTREFSARSLKPADAALT